MWEGGGYHPFRLPQLYSVQVNTSQFQGVSSSIQLLHVPGELVTLPPLILFLSPMTSLVIWGNFSTLPGPSSWDEGQRLLDKTGSTETLASLFFQAQKSPKPLILICFQRIFACLQDTAWMPGLRMNQLGNYPTANFNKQSSVWSETRWKDRSRQALSACVRAVVPLTLEEPQQRTSGGAMSNVK